MPTDLEIIVPVAPGEQEWTRLVDWLAGLGGDLRMTVASSETRPPDFAEGERLGWLECPAVGRAQQMNYAASLSEATHLWFVHADSRPDGAAHERLLGALGRFPDALHYFRLRFYDGGGAMRINEWGANMRSRVFRAPFGDQALCLSRALFAELGGYDERCDYGEDHLLVRKARKKGVRLNCIDHPMPTSARKYARHGWLKVVLNHQYKWITQALRD